MANNKIQLSDGTVLIDLTADTAIAADVIKNKIFHLANGTIAVGTAETAGSYNVESTDNGDGTQDIDIYDVIAPAINPLSVTQNGTYTAPEGEGYSPVVVNVQEQEIRLQGKTATQNGTVTADPGYDGLDTVVVNVPTGTPRTQSDITVSGRTIVVPAGLYDVQVSKDVALGTAGTPTATKGTVSNHSVSITPFVTNATGYITGDTKAGAAVTVTAAELVSGSETKTANGTYDVTNLQTLVVNVPTPMNVQAYIGYDSKTGSNVYVATSVSLTVAKTGTYIVGWAGWRQQNSGSQYGSQLYIDGTAYGSEQTTFENSMQTVTLDNVSLREGQTITVWVKPRSNSYWMAAGYLAIRQTA